MTRVRKVTIAILLVVLSTALAGTFLTRGVMEYLPFLQAKKGNWTGEYVSHGIVDQRPWQTAATLAGHLHTMSTANLNLVTEYEKPRLTRKYVANCVLSVRYEK